MKSKTLHSKAGPYAGGSGGSIEPSLGHFMLDQPQRNNKTPLKFGMEVFIY